MLPKWVKNLLAPTPLLERLLLLTHGYLAPFVGLTYHVGEKLGVQKDGLGGVVCPGIEYGTKMLLWEITLNFWRDEIGSKWFVKSST